MENSEPNKAIEDTPDEEVWRAIRRLDPEQIKDTSNIACMITLLALLVVGAVVWFLLHFRGVE